MLLDQRTEGSMLWFFGPVLFLIFTEVTDLMEKRTSAAVFVRIVEPDGSSFDFWNLDQWPLWLFGAGQTKVWFSWVLLSCDVLEKLLQCVFGVEQLERDLVFHHEVS